MYTIEELERYDYFKELLKDNKIEYLLDSLTGVIQRQYMIEFVKHLIDNKIEFTMAILDLDSFKQINDNYGHDVGDIVLVDVANSLKEYIGDQGILGRYGGDEFIFIYFGPSDYDSIHDFYATLYDNKKILRKIVKTPSVSPFITGTIGSSSYPKDATDYDTLFKLSDKTLYRGKQKGRNCFIIYVKEKHEHLVIENIRPLDLFDAFVHLKRTFDTNLSVKNKIITSTSYLTSEMRINKILFLSKENDKLFDLVTNKVIGQIDFQKDKKMIKIIEEKSNFHASLRDEIYQVAPSLCTSLDKLNIQSVLIIKIDIFGKNYGYIMYAEERGARIWESQEKAILSIFSRFIAEAFYTNSSN